MECAMPHYDDSFLVDCEKKLKNAHSYRPHKQFAISNGSGITKLSLHRPPTQSSTLPLQQQQQQQYQDNGTFGKWRKWYFTWKRNASSVSSTATMPPMPIYRSICSANNNSTFNCKFNRNKHKRPINLFTQFLDNPTSVNAA